MALKTKQMTATEARGLQTLHNKMADVMEGKASKASLQLVIESLLLSVVPKFIGLAGTAVNVLVKISEMQNNSANRSYLRGAAKAFGQIASRLENGGYQRAEVQQVWITYPSISTRHELVQGNNSTPEKAYIIKRIQLKSGSWITPTN